MSLLKKTRSTVYSEDSLVHIKPDHFPVIIRTLKVYKKNNEELQKATSIWEVLRAYNCTAIYDEEGIKSLRLRADEWDISLMVFFSVLARHVEPGGYIRIIDENKKNYWIYRFTGFSLKRNNLISRRIDFQDEEDLIKNFKELSNGLFNLGKNKQDLIEILKKVYMENILE